MNLPFISRQSHDLIVATEQARGVSFEQAWREAESRYRVLLDLVLAKAQPRTIPEREMDPVSEVIRGRSGSNGTVRKALGNYVKTARAQGVTEDIIINNLTVWPSSDDEGVDQ